MASTYELIVKAVDQTSGPLSRIERNLKNVNRAASRTNIQSVTGAKSAAGAGILAGAIAKIPGPLVAIGIAATAAGLGMRSIINSTKEFESVQNGLRLITNGTADLNKKTNELRKLAASTRTSFGATAELFTKLTISTADLGASTEDVVKVTGNLSKALQVAGADGQTASSVIRQFGQAMASGTVRGDEFNSLVEGLGPTLALMAKETGISVGELRKMSQAGELTAEVMFNMLKSSTALEEAFSKMNKTLEQTETAFGDAFDRALVNIGKASGITDIYAQALDNVTRKLNNFSQRQEDAQDPLKAMAIRLIEIRERMKILEKVTEENSGAFQHYFNTTKNAKEELKKLRMEQHEVNKAMDAHIKKTNEAAAATERKAKADKLASRILDDNKIALAANADAIKLAKSVRGTNADFELASPLQQAEMRLKDLQNSAASLRTLIKDGVIPNNLEWATTTRDLNDAITVQLAKIKEIEKELANAAKATADKAAADEEKRKKKLAEDLLKTIRATNKAKEKERKQQEETAKEILASLEKQIAKRKAESEAVDRQILSYASLRSEVVQTANTNAEYDAALAAVNTTLAENTRLTVAQKEGLLQNKTALEETIEKRKQEAALLAEVGVKGADMIKTYQDEAKELRELNTALDNVAIISEKAGVSQEFLTNKIMEAMKANELYKESALTSAQIIDEGFKKAVGSLPKELSTAIVKGENLFKTLENSFNNMLENILQQILQSQIQQALTQLLTPSGGGGGSSNFLATAASFLFGAPGKAVGGPVAKDRPYMVGEQGPEMFMPNTAGQIVSNSELNSGGGGAVVNFNINAIDTQTGVEFLLENKKNIIGMVSQGYNQRGRQGITS
jgi:tape measure domain-containing protein